MLFYNEDWIHFIMTRYNSGTEVTEQTLKDYIYSFKGTQVTDFAMNVNGTISTAQSEVFETFADKYLATEENGVEVDFKNTFAKVAYNLICEKKIDMYKIWIDALKETGINPWISIRVNDCHGNTEKTDVRKSSFVEANPDLHLASYRNGTGYFDKCLDYSNEKVRSRMLAYIEEMLDRYDVYGLELDMMRDFIFTKPGFEQEINKFLSGVLEVKNKFEEKYKHKIKLMLLLPSSPNLCLEKGINLIEYSNEIDNVVIIARWQTTDTDMPIELWKQLLRGTNIKLGCGQQLYTRPYLAHKPAITSTKMAFGQAMANLSRGCDFVYLYNYMDMVEYETGLETYVYDESIRNDANRPFLFGNIGRIETLIKQERSHVVTYADFTNCSLTVSSVLPLEFTGRTGFKTVKIPVGKIPEKAKVKLVLGVNSEEKLALSDFEIYANSAECNCSGTKRLHEKIYEKECYVFDITKNFADIIYAEIRTKKAALVEYVMIDVIPQ